MSKIANLSGYYPALVLDAKQNVHLVWEQRVGGEPEYSIFYARRAGKKWTAPVCISGAARYAEVPDIAYRAGRIVVSFQSRRPDNVMELHLVESTDGGETWSK
ncbi:MAG: exo-alpha-sialidase [Blastocatellia bacterium]|nr:exo-alpha-sialidase [Blastocatellia bacterium]